MEKTKFRTQFNYSKAKGEEGEKNFQPSMTEQDKTMSIREILQRYARGLPIDGEKTPIYHGEEDDFPDMANLDLAERQEIVEHYQNELDELKDKYNKKKQQSKAKDTKQKDSNKDETEDKTKSGQSDSTGDDTGTTGNVHGTNTAKSGK